MTTAPTRRDLAGGDRSNKETSPTDTPIETRRAARVPGSRRPQLGRAGPGRRQWRSAGRRSGRGRSAWPGGRVSAAVTLVGRRLGRPLAGGGGPTGRGLTGKRYSGAAVVRGGLRQAREHRLSAVKGLRCEARRRRRREAMTSALPPPDEVSEMSS